MTFRLNYYNTKNANIGKYCSSLHIQSCKNTLSPLHFIVRRRLTTTTSYVFTPALRPRWTALPRRADVFSAYVGQPIICSENAATYALITQPSLPYNSCRQDKLHLANRILRFTAPTALFSYSLKQSSRGFVFQLPSNYVYALLRWFSLLHAVRTCRNLWTPGPFSRRSSLPHFASQDE